MHFSIFSIKSPFHRTNLPCIFVLFHQYTTFISTNRGSFDHYVTFCILSVRWLFRCCLFKHLFYFETIQFCLSSINDRWKEIKNIPWRSISRFSHSKLALLVNCLSFKPLSILRDVAALLDEYNNSSSFSPPPHVFSTQLLFLPFSFFVLLAFIFSYCSGFPTFSFFSNHQMFPNLIHPCNLSLLTDTLPQHSNLSLRLQKHPLYPRAC